MYKRQLLVVISFIALPTWCETVTKDELVTNPSDYLVYKKFSTEPFTGSIKATSINPVEGSYNNGKKYGLWVTFYKSGLEQWKNYEPWLEPLKNALGDLV